MFISLITTIPTIRYDKDLATMVRVIREFLKIPETVFTTQVFLGIFYRFVYLFQFCRKSWTSAGCSMSMPTNCLSPPHPHRWKPPSGHNWKVMKWKTKNCSENCCCLFPALFFHHWRFRLCTQTSLFSSTRASTMQANISTEISGALRIILWTSDNL